MKNKNEDIFDILIVKMLLYVLILINVVCVFVNVYYENYWVILLNTWAIFNCGLPLLLERKDEDDGLS